MGYRQITATKFEDLDSKSIKMFFPTAQKTYHAYVFINSSKE